MSDTRAGGLAALFNAAAYSLGFVVLIGLLGEQPVPVAARVAWVLERSTLLGLWYLVIYVAFGVSLTVLVVVLHERFEGDRHLPIRLASAFGLIWAGLVIASGMIAIVGLEALERAHEATPDQAADLWLAIDTVRDGLGGGVELVGGLWMVLVSVGSLRGHTLPRTLDALGLLTGLAGCVSVLPGLAGAGALFGMGQIVWFVRVGGELIGARGKLLRHCA